MPNNHPLYGQSYGLLSEFWKQQLDNLVNYGKDVASGDVMRRGIVWGDTPLGGGIEGYTRGVLSPWTGDRQAFGEVLGDAIPGGGLLGTIAGKGAKLPMDEASRMQRANAYDFSGYHGAGSDIRQMNGMTWLSEAPELANEYASMRYHMGGAPNVMPLRAKTGNFLDADKMPNTVTVGSFANEAFEQAKARGVEIDEKKARSLIQRIKKGAAVEESGPHYSRHDFWYRPSDYFGEDGGKAINELLDMLGIDSISMTEHGQKTIGVRDPKNIRSRFAKFDPAKADSADLLASMGALGLLGGGLGYGLLDPNPSY